MAFVVASIPGFIMAAILYFTVREPERRGIDGATSVDAEKPSFVTAITFIWSQNSVRHIVFGLAVAGFASNGLGAWFSSFLIRHHGFSLKEAGFYIAMSLGPIAACGIFFAGYLSDKLAVHGIRLRGLLVTGSCALCIPTIALMLTTSNRLSAVVLLQVYSFVSIGIWAPSYAICQTLVPPGMRGLVASFTYVSVATGAFSPHITGMLSDAWSDGNSGLGLSSAMLALSVVYVWATAHFFVASRHMEADSCRV